MLLVVRRDYSNPAVSSPMKKAVILKALKKKKDRMSAETAVEVLPLQVLWAIPTDDVIATIVLEIYTFW